MLVGAEHLLPPLPKAELRVRSASERNTAS